MNESITIITIITHLIIICLLFAAWSRVNLQKIISFTGNLVILAEAIYLLTYAWQNGTTVVHAANWKAPFGISFVLDTFSATMVLLTAISGIAVSIYAGASLLRPRMKYGFYTVFQFLLLGINGSFLTGDAFNLYVWFEIMIMSSFVLLSLGAEKKQLEATVKYFTLNFLASTIFLTGLGILYGLTGTLNLADVSLKMQSVNSGLKELCAIFFLIGFGIKSGMFPLYYWLPAAYHTPPSSVTAIFGGLLTKVGVYAIIRMFSLVFHDLPLMNNMFIVLGGLTIIFGALGAVAQKHITRIFGYLIICHIGYMIGGFGLFNKMALAGVVFYLVHDVVVKTNIFMLCGLIFKIKGSYELKDLGGLYSQYPKIALLATIPLLSLVGVPPLSGFWPKIPLIQGAVENGNYFYLVTLIAGSIATLIIIARIWAEVFWKKDPGYSVPKEKFSYFKEIPFDRQFRYLAPIIILAAVSLLIGFGASYIYTLSERIAEELLNPEIYYIGKILQ